MMKVVQMNRRELLRNSLLTVGAVSAAATVAGAQSISPARPEVPPQSPKRKGSGPAPNILWVCTDQQRFDTIQGLSNSLIRTPNLEKFMAQSVTFTNTFCQTPICSPSRGSFNTGRYPRCTGLRANGQRIRPTEQLISKILADNNYDCGLVGKLHLSPCQNRLEDRIEDGYRLFEWSHDLTAGGPEHNRWRAWLRKQGVTLPDAPKQHVWGMPIDLKYTQTGWCAQVAQDFMREKRSDKPWIMQVNIFQPHHPFFPTEEYLHRYDPAKMPDPAYKEGELLHKTPFQQLDHTAAYGGTALSFTKTSPETHREIKAAYYAMIEQVDTVMGQMLQTLDETGQADNTIVIFMSDHGEMLGDHGLYLKGPFFYDCLTRVPLIMRFPNHYKAGLKVDALVELVDLFPTLLETTDIPIPAGVQGRSLMPLLTGTTTRHRDSVYMEYYNSNFEYPITPMITSLRTEHHKLNFCDRAEFGELYDLQKDPGEVTNLWNDPHARDVQQMMMQSLMVRMIDATDPLPQKVSPW
jgi:arylsulfatase A-like enzyme